VGKIIIVVIGFLIVMGTFSGLSWLIDQNLNHWLVGPIVVGYVLALLIGIGLIAGPFMEEDNSGKGDGTRPRNP